MKETKRQLIPFSFYDRTGMEAHLENMARQGWMLQRITNWGWSYRRGEPKAVHFAISYYPRASEFEPEPTEEQLTFQDFCRRSGWHLAAASGQMQVFYNEQEDPVPIETDPVLELEMVAKASRRMLPVHIVFLLLGFCMGGSWCYSLFHDPIGLLASASSLFLGLCWLCLFLYAAVDLTLYFTWLFRAKRAARQEEFLPTRGCHRLMQGIEVLTVAGLVYWLLVSRLPGSQLLFLAMLLGYAALVLIVNGTKELLKRKKVSAKVNRTVTLAVDGVLALAIMGGISLGLLQAFQSGAFSIADYLETPVSAAELLGTDNGAYTTSTSFDTSALVTRQEFRQWSRTQPDLPGLELTVVKVHVPGLYGLCFSQLYHAYDAAPKTDETGTVHIPGAAYRQIDAAPWGAQTAYRLYEGETPTNRYLLCWPGQLAELSADWDLTPGQITAAGAELTPA